MNRLPLAVITGFGKMTGTALVQRFSASHQVWDLDNGGFPNDHLPGSHLALLDQIVPGMSIEESLNVRDFIHMNLSCRYTDWVSSQYKRAGPGEAVPPTTLVIYNSGNTNCDMSILEQFSPAVRLVVTCVGLLESFGLGNSPTFAEQVLRHIKFSKTHSPSELLLLNTTKLQRPKLFKPPNTNAADRFEWLCQAVAERVQHRGIQVRMSRFVGTMHDGGGEAVDPEQFADTLHWLYQQK